MPFVLVFVACVLFCSIQAIKDKLEISDIDKALGLIGNVSEIINYDDNQHRNLLEVVGSYSIYNHHDFSAIAASENYTCDEIVRWLGTEKHYSNDKKNSLFGILASNDQRECQRQPVVLLKDISFGMISKNGRSFFHNKALGTEARTCGEQDDYVVAYLSNYSINNNFSHFLHGLLRLFCALLDARIFIWDNKAQQFVQTRSYTIWLDEYFRLTPEKEMWLKSFGGNIRKLDKLPKEGNCVSSKVLLYGSGCVRLLPPEKWFGYPGCRAKDILSAFGTYMRSKHLAPKASDLQFVDNLDQLDSGSVGLRVAFAVRDVGAKTGMRQINNLGNIQHLIKKTQHVRSSVENVTFEHLDMPSTIRYMAGVHIFVSVHGAGMTNMFFMNSGAAVIEIIPFPLCNCRSPDYFYGVGGYYHGSAVALGIKHYYYCVPAYDVKWHQKPVDAKSGGKCSWKHLHAVESVFVDPSQFVSLMRKVERDLVVDGTIILTKPIINVSPHANG